MPEMNEKSFTEFLEAAFQDTGKPKWLAVWCPFCADLVGIGNVPDSGNVTRCEHELRLIAPFKEYAEKHKP